ncbi:MAG: hypothetical protein EXR11_00680 [Rhodospirillaceae bacterium]|nr:hypothetical protein [Rhodospirillaceae bacterium]
MVVARHGKVVAVESVGWADIEKKRPITPDTIFRLFVHQSPHGYGNTDFDG